jgi:hypothetical protein
MFKACLKTPGISLFLTKAWQEIAADKILLFLLFLFSAFYLPHAFILLEDIGLIGAYENDPGSHIEAMQTLLRSYNMHAGYHSKFYGWTYFSLNFFLLLPIKIFLLTFAIESKFFLYFAIRFILFVIGLASLAAFHQLVKKLFKNEFLALLAALFYIFSPVGFKFFYFIHPETTGSLFIFLAMLVLLEFIKEPSRKLYLLGLIFLVLASLSKQIFFFIALPILFLFFHFYCVSSRKKYFEFIASKEFVEKLSKTAAIAVLTLFVIHPNAILELPEFLQYQTQQREVFINGPYAITIEESFGKWLDLCLKIPLLNFFFITSPFILFIGLRSYFCDKKSQYLLAVFNTVFAWIILLLIAAFNRLLIESQYLQPVYPFFILNFLVVCNFVQKNYCRKIANIFLAYFIILTLALNICQVVPQVITRFFYKKSAAYQSYEYVKQNLTPNDRLAFDHHVALPQNMRNIGCHYWQGCGTNQIEEFQPNYVMLNELYSVNGKPHLENERLKKYVKDHHLSLERKLSDDDVTISIYKK